MGDFRLDLFKESDRILRALPADKPFFAYVQTAGNHRPFTIPKDNDGFQVSDKTVEQVQPPVRAAWSSTTRCACWISISGG